MQVRQAFRALLNSDSGMTTLDLRTNPNLNDPATPLGTALQYWFAGEPTVAGEHVNERNALQNSTVFCCVRLIAESVAALPLRVYQHEGDTRTEAPTHSLSYLLSTEPNPEMSAPVFYECLIMCLALTGNCYTEVERDSTGKPVALWPLHPLQTEPVRNPAGTLMYQTGVGGTQRTISASDVIHVPLFSWDGLKGLSPIGQQRQTLGLAQATLKQGARFFGNGSRPGGLLTPKSPTLTPAQAQQMREFWEAQSAGVNQGRIAVLPSDFQYTALGMSLEDSQFLQARGYSRNEICAIYRVDPHYAGDTTRQSNSNHEQSSLSLYQDTLTPYIRKIELEFRRKLLPRTGRVESAFTLAFDLTERLRADLKTTLDSIAVGRQWSVLTANEGRKMLGLNPVPGAEGDMLLSPVNMINAAKAVDWMPQASTPTKDTTNAKA